MPVKVSIIVPIYNSEKYISQTLQSLTRQTLKDIEIVCVDNCSIDASWQIVQNFASEDDRIIAYKQKQNVGQNSNVNTGLQLTSGEYVAECDSDDYVAENMYEVLYAEASRAQADVVKCGFWNTYCERKIPAPQIECGIEKPFDPMRIGCADRYLLLRMQPHLMSGIARREFIVGNRLMYRPDGMFEDTSLTFKIRTTAKRYSCVPDLLYYYRKDNDNSGSNTIQNMYGICEQYEEIKRYNDDHCLHLDDEIAAMRFYSYMWNLSRMKSSEQQFEFIQRAAKDFAEENAPEYLFSYYDYRRYKAIMEMA